MRHRSLRSLVVILLCPAIVAGCAVFHDGARSDDIAESSPLPSSPFERKLVDRYFMEGSILQMQEHFAEAIDQYELVIHLAPHHAAARYALARCYQALGRNDTALVYAEGAITLTPDNVDARMQLAELLLLNGRLARSVDQYEQVIKLEPGNIQARYNAARLLQRIDPARAIAHYEYIRKYLGEDYNALLNLAELYMNQRNYDGVVDVMRELLVLDASNADLYRILDDAYQRGRRYDDATKLLADVAEHLDPDSVYEDFMIDEASRTVKNIEADTSIALAGYARRVASIITERFPKRWEAGYYGGLIHYRLNDSTAADSLMLKAFTNRGATASAWSEAASRYIEDGNGLRALRFMLPTAGRFREDNNIPYLIGYAYFTLGRNDSAERYIKKSLAIDEENGEAWGRLAEVYEREDKPAACENAFDQAVEYDDDDASLLNNFAYFLAGRGRRLEFALALIDRALDQEPDNESFLDTKGWIYFKLADYKHALQYIQRSADIGGATSEVFEHLGDTQRALGDLAGARSSYGRALRLAPDNAELGKKLELVK